MGAARGGMRRGPDGACRPPGQEKWVATWRIEIDMASATDFLNGSIVGAVVAAVFGLARDTLRNRPQLTVEVVSGRAFHAGEGGYGSERTWYYSRLPPPGQ